MATTSGNQVDTLTDHSSRSGRFMLVAKTVELTAGFDIRAIDPTAPLKDFGLDSLSMIDTMMKIEETLGTEIPDAEIAKIRTLDDLMRVVDAQ